MVTPTLRNDAADGQPESIDACCIWALDRVESLSLDPLCHQAFDTDPQTVSVTIMTEWRQGCEPQVVDACVNTDAKAPLSAPHGAQTHRFEGKYS